MKSSLSTDYGSPRHWERIIEFAAKHDVSRLVFWGDISIGFSRPYHYPKYPKLMPDNGKKKLELLRDHLIEVAEMTARAGMEFWHVFQVLDIPDAEHVRSVLPELFNEHGEPDMSGELAYQLLRDQLDELLELVPGLHGIEMWVMEGARVVIAGLRHQKLSTEEICARIVDTVYDHLVRSGCKLVVDLHTSGGDPISRQGLLKAAVRHPDIILSGDNVLGDYHLHLPFNTLLKQAAETNPVQVNFDLNAEYWGRNFVPSSALSQYAAHIEEARDLGAVYINGRVSTGHDRVYPHCNVLPSRRRFYPGLEGIGDATPLPSDLEITCTDTLGAFNAAFFCRRVRDKEVQPEEVVEDFLCREFGKAAVALVPAFMKLEGLLGKLFYTDKNYYAGQSHPPTPGLVRCYALQFHLTYPPGTDFPTPEVLAQTGKTTHVAFTGWPTPFGHKCAGTEAMIREKEEVLSEAEKLLQDIKEATQELSLEDRDFLIKQFSDLAFFAKAYRFLLEAHAHYFLEEAGRKQGELPEERRLKEVLEQIQAAADEWEARYPGGRYRMTETLRDWVKIMGQG